VDTLKIEQEIRRTSCLKDCMSSTPTESLCTSRGCKVYENFIDIGALRDVYHQHVTEFCPLTHPCYLQDEMHSQKQRADTLKTFERVLGIRVQALDREKRLTLPDHLVENQGCPFWQQSSTDVNIHISRYYKNDFVLCEGTLQRTDACTTIIDCYVIIPVEIYICQIDIVVYKDILTSLSYTLGDVLESFNLTQGFPVDTDYTYTSFVSGEWKHIRIEACMLTTCLYELLQCKNIQATNAANFFRLSPVGVDQLI